ncbi:hypothetical protein COD96_06395 [Bacillus thuringiensis]|nr:hypothetical protein CON19_28140 [Bacillus thuringiensis]PFD44786.1 hypothetical protein CN281_19205 [Bacillus cereus]PGV72094.1 hypothetical protein COD96_06395 [Bacillus thuringiensis]
MRGVELIKEETAGDKHACYAPLTKELTSLKRITDYNQYIMMQNLEEYYKRMYEMDSVIIGVEKNSSLNLVNKRGFNN